jgi:hypothetical protein
MANAAGRSVDGQRCFVAARAARSEVDSILLTHAEVAIALAGFASVAAVLQRPLSPVQRQRFLAILFAALLLVLGSLVPVWLLEVGVIGPVLWRIASAFLLVLSLIQCLVLVYLPLRKLGASSFVVINLPVTYLGYSLVAAVIGLLVVNLIGVPTPGFGLYYAALLAALASVFLAFADVVTIGDDEAS